MIKGILLIGNILLSLLLSAQILPNRYVEEVFADFNESTAIKFSTDVPVPQAGGGFYEWITGYPLNVTEYATYNTNLYMDIFQPAEDTIAIRPLVIICFGGGFLAGSRDHWGMREIAIQLAKRGYVTATIDYRLGMNIFDADLSMRAPYRGLQDGRSAVRFFKADASVENSYRIDTSNIYIGGHSAGAFIALHNAYLNTEDKRPLSTYNWTQDGHAVPDQLCLDCVGDNQSFYGNAKAVFSLAGALGFPDYIETASDPSVVMFHSQDDDTVPFDSGQPFSSLLWAVVGSDLPDVYGSQAIANQATSVGLEYQFNAYLNRGHGVHEETASTLYADIIPKISDSFYVHLLKPPIHPIIGNTTICNDMLSQSYATISGKAHYYDWEITGGTIEEFDIYNNTISVIWDGNSDQHQIKLTPYSIQGARGAASIIEAKILIPLINTWIGTDGMWENPSNWSLGHIPTFCEEVVFPDLINSISVNFPTQTEVSIRSLSIGKNAKLLLGDSAILTIDRESSGL